MMDDWDNWMAGWNNPGFRTGLFLLLLWALFWKGLALWRSARNGEKYWFIALLIFQTWGLLELVYLFYFAKKKLTIAKLKNMFQGTKK